MICCRRVAMLLACVAGLLGALAGCAGRAPGTAEPVRPAVAGEQLGRLGAVRIPVTAVASGVGLSQPSAAVPLPDSLLGTVGSRIDSILGDPALRGAEVALLVESLAMGQIVCERSADLPLVPASTMKIVTSSLALSILGPAHRFTTDVATDGALRGGALEGNLYVRGRGDPSLTTEEVWKLAEEVQILGVERVTGDVVLDASYFDSLSAEPKDDDDGDKAYQARTGALAPNFGSVAVHVRPGEKVGDPALVAVAPVTGYVEIVNRATTGSSRRESTIEVARSLRRGRNTVTVTGRIPAGSGGGVWNRNVDDPAAYFGALFTEDLAKCGIRIDGCVRKASAPTGARVLVEHRSKPLAVIVRDLNKYSNNFIAEQLLKAVSAHTLGPPGTTAGGVSLAAALLRSVGVDSLAFRVADGSGLSRENLMTPRALLALSRHMLADFGTAPEFAASLSVGGIDGTLARRMGGDDLRGAVRGKTGHLDGVSAVCGLLHTATRGDLLFSMISNGFECGSPAMRAIEERVLGVLQGL